MNILELTTEERRTIYERQSGMCALTGKKFEEFTDSMETEFVAICDKIGATDNDNIVMLWKQRKDFSKDDLRKYFLPHANFSNYDDSQKANEFRVDVEEVISLSASSSSSRQVRNRIKELTGYLTGLGISNSIKNEFRGLLKAANENLTRKESENREKYKEETDKNYAIIKEKVDAAVEFAKDAPLFKDAKAKLLEVQKELRSLKLNLNYKNELDALLTDEVRKVNEKFHSWSENNEMEIIENYYSLRNIVDDTVNKAFTFETFPEARDVLVEVQGQIREKMLRKIQKDELFVIIRNTFDELREKFTEYKRVTDEESIENYAIVKPQIDAAIEFSKSLSVEDVNDAKERLIKAQVLIKETRLKREQKDELFVAIREVFTDVNKIAVEERKKFEAESEDSYKSLLPKIELTIVDIENGLDFRQSGDDLASISTDLQLARLKRSHREELYGKLRLAYKLLNNKRDEFNKYRFTEKKKRLAEALEDLKQKNERIIKLLGKDNELLAKQQEKLSKIPEDNTTLKERNQQIIKETKSRIAEKEKIIFNSEKRILELKKEIEKTIKLEKDIEGRKRERNTKQAKNEENVPAKVETTEPQSEL